ncbi:MAG: glycosyltransferase [Methanomicrobiales archaeon]|nr:glycosyltransferase [Methanomicrobiales archaeon]
MSAGRAADGAGGWLQVPARRRAAPSGARATGNPGSGGRHGKTPALPRVFGEPPPAGAGESRARIGMNRTAAERYRGRGSGGGGRGAFITVLSSAVVLLLFLVLVRDTYSALFLSAYPPVSRIFSAILVACLFFVALEFVSYGDNLLRSMLIYRGGFQSPGPSRNPSPPVAVFIPVYNEDPSLVETCLKTCKGIEWPDLRIYLLDDSTNAEMGESNERFCRSLGVARITRQHRRGFKAGAINDAIPMLGEEVQYLLVLDVDQRVTPKFLRDLVPILEKDGDLSYLQLPQYFHSRNGNALATCYSYHQHLYNKHICRGLHVQDAVLLTGTNCLFRLSHLRAIGGMDESCITEDVATTFVYLTRGYRGAFLDAIYAEGVPPPSLAAYYTQQMRWAYGNTQHFKTVVRTFFKNPKVLSVSQWLAFVMTELSYLLGLVNPILLLFPAVILLFNVRLVPVILPTFFAPILVLVLGVQYYTSIAERRYRLLDLLKSQAILASISFIYARAILYVLMGKNLGFSVTPKTPGRTAGSSFGVHTMVLVSFFGISIVSSAMGIWRLISGVSSAQVPVALFWALYSLGILLTFLRIHLQDAERARRAGAAA